MLERSIHFNSPHRIAFTRDVFSEHNQTLAGILAGEPSSGKILVFVDNGLATASPGLVPGMKSYFAAQTCANLNLQGQPQIIEGGEGSKNQWTNVERIWQSIHDHRLCRHSYVLAVGGGAVLDVVGFAAATAHRGVRLVRLPSTTLSQGDGGVGVKNGVNFFGKKNWIGTFDVPFAVVNDLNFLGTLPASAMRDGIIEALKVALIRDARFFHDIERRGAQLAQLHLEAVEELVQRSARLHVEHIATSGDPFELGSARPLDFGHWSAHKLEQLSGFTIGHGEAVAMGIALDLIYATRAGILKRDVTERILALMKLIGFQLYDKRMGQRKPDRKWAILEGLDEFREHLGGELTITLITGIGKGVEFHEMDEDIILQSLDELATRVEADSAVTP